MIDSKKFKEFKEILKSPKLKIIAFTLAITVVTSIIVRGSIAFFTDAKQSEAVFTAGNVYIELSEAAVEKGDSGHLVEATSENRIYGNDINDTGGLVINNYGVVFPGQTIHKDPTIENVGMGSAWIAAKVIIEDGVGDIHRLYCYNDFSDDIDIERMLQGGLLDEAIHVDTWNGIPDVCYNENYAMVQHSNHQNGRYEFYFFMLQPLKKGESVELFDTFFIDGFFGNEEMQEFKEFKITVQAFGVQTFGFSSCLEAMEGAFTEHFENAR